MIGSSRSLGSSTKRLNGLVSTGIVALEGSVRIRKYIVSSVFSGPAFLNQEGGCCIPDPPSQMEYGIHVLMEYIVFMYYVFCM